jgi:archaellum component FlaC
MKKQATKKTYSEDYVGAMLEEIRSDFKVFGEGLNDVRRVVDEIKVELNEVKEDLSIFKIETRANFETLFEFRDEMIGFREETRENFKTLFEFRDETKSNFATIFDYFSGIDDELAEIKAELERGKKAGKMEESWFKKIEQRVSIVEKQLKSQKSLAIK